MAKETKTKASSPTTKAAKSEAKPSKPTKTKETVKNGKGSAPRNCFSEKYLDNYDSIKW